MNRRRFFAAIAAIPVIGKLVVGRSSGKTDCRWDFVVTTSSQLTTEQVAFLATRIEQTRIREV
jgi:hypothetical protein